jgi:hypothetical protein
MVFNCLTKLNIEGTIAISPWLTVCNICGSLNSIWYLVVWKNWVLREQLQYHHDWRFAIDAHGHVKGGSCNEQKKCKWMFDNVLVT